MFVGHAVAPRPRVDCDEGNASDGAEPGGTVAAQVPERDPRNLKAGE